MIVPRRRGRGLEVFACGSEYAAFPFRSTDASWSLRGQTAPVPPLTVTALNNDPLIKDEIYPSVMMNLRHKINTSGSF